MKHKVERLTADLSAFPDLVVIYLGMRVYSLRGLMTLVRFGPRISEAVEQRPDGLLLHEPVIYSLFPPHFGMRQYWRDFESLETWSRSLPHQEWWTQYLRDPAGTGFWHETYFMRGGMESVFDDMRTPVGFMGFAEVKPMRGPMFTARGRLGLKGEPARPSPVSEEKFYNP